VNEVLEAKVCEEIRAWSSYALEKPNSNYNDFPACPFAAKAWADRKVDIQFKHEVSPLPLYSILKNYNDDFELIIVVDFEYDDDQERYHNYLDGINEVISENCFGDRDLYVMGFHPEDETNELIETANFDSTVEYLYGMIFVQRLGLLCKASEKLMSKGYYDRDHGNYEVRQILKKRNELYRRIINARD
tara:strand:- start:599 stop:1165 length:567 start_codon:yes stop_codon:yes gene_type:complete